MGLHFFDGFDHEDLGIWHTRSGGSLESEITQQSERAMRWTNETGYVRAYVGLNANGTWNSADRNVWVAYQIYVVALPTSGNFYMLSKMNPFSKSRLRIKDDGELQITSDSGGSSNYENTGITLSTGKWYTVSHNREENVNSRVKVRETLTEMLVGSYTHSTGSNNAEEVEYVHVGPEEAGNGDVIFDNVVIDTSTGAVADPVDTLGITNWVCLDGIPIADGTYNHGNWAGSYQDVDEQPSDDSTTYRSNGSSGDGAAFTSEMQGAAGYPVSIDEVYGVLASVRGWGNTGWRVRFRSGSTDNNWTNATQVESWNWYSRFYDNDPDTASEWTTAAIENLELGAERTAGSLQIRVTATYVQVLAKPAPTGGQGPIWFMFENARSKWDELFGGLKAPKNRGHIWKPEPQILTPTAAQVKALAA